MTNLTFDEVKDFVKASPSRTGLRFKVYIEGTTWKTKEHFVPSDEPLDRHHMSYDINDPKPACQARYVFQETN